VVTRHVFPTDLPKIAMKKTTHSNHGFTLIELLVVIAIIAVLAGIGSAALLSATDKAQTASEVSAAKTLVSAYQAAAADNAGTFMAALNEDRNLKASDVRNADGRTVPNARARARYPFRLAPYFNYAVDGALLAGNNRQQLLKVMNLSSPSGGMYDYGVSAFPSFGINRHHLGGRIDRSGKVDTSAAYADCIRTVAQADHSIIAFVSAGSSDIDGYEFVYSPGGPGGSWSGEEWTEGTDPSNFGYVHPRHGGKAIAAFLDGSTRLMTIEELRDMRLWSRQAAQADDPNYTVSQ
jgi:prepilin-type N-terminal cleavage/methylation domain-containing protein/prepilin-type processing-associated H-X9-DG protein